MEIRAKSQAVLENNVESRQNSAWQKIKKNSEVIEV
jgi:hypothetical protein